MVARVIGPHDSDPSRFKEEVLDSGYYHESNEVLWPDWFTPAMRIYARGYIVTSDQLSEVDLLHIFSGSTYYGTSRQRYYLWQRHLPAEQALTPLDLMQARYAVASSWVRRRRVQRNAERGILLREG